MKSVWGWKIASVGEFYFAYPISMKRLRAPFEGALKSDKTDFLMFGRTFVELPPAFTLIEVKQGDVGILVVVVVVLEGH